MSAIGQVLREIMGVPSKFTLEVVSGDAPPHTHHEDGWTKWKNGSPKKYTRAVNSLRVGREWLHKVFPSYYVQARIGPTGAPQEIPRDDVERARLLLEWLPKRLSNGTTPPGWPFHRSRSTNPEEDRLYAE